MSLSVNERGNLRKPVKKVFVKNPNKLDLHLKEKTNETAQ